MAETPFHEPTSIMVVGLVMLMASSKKGLAAESHDWRSGSKPMSSIWS